MHFRVLDSWRGIAACLVAVGHAPIYSHITLSPIAGNAFLFVDFFFVLSGFVIAFNYRDRLAAGFGIVRFMLLRFGRLYPLHLVMLGLFIAHEATGILFDGVLGGGEGNAFSDNKNIYTIVTNALLIQSIFFQDHNAWNGPSWSISTEFYTYLIFAFVFAFVRKGYLLVVSSIATLFFLVLIALIDMHPPFDYSIFRCTFGFAAGVIVFEVYSSYRSRLARLLARRRFATALELCLFAGLFYFISVAATPPLSILATALFAIVVLVFAFEAGAVSGVLSRGLFAEFGRLSYSIYMIHMLLFVSLLDVGLLLSKLLDIRLIDRIGDGNLSLNVGLWLGDLAVVAVLAMVVVCSRVSFAIVEAPGRRWFRAIAGRTGVPTVQGKALPTQ